ncbi:MAG: hypothetical protein K6T83_02445 [Alicyclobacillus sp.]|nr:hypothetical protein [Alicyclobacillus sp.]
MSANLTPGVDIGEAIRKVNALVKHAKQLGFDILGADVGPHMNPGDVYDAYEATQYTPVASDVLESGLCGPFAAVYLHQKPDVDATAWREYVTQTYNDRYVRGFYHGFRLVVPEPQDECEVHYIRGVYDGVMAHAAVL